MSLFWNFQNASLRKCHVHFLRNSTQLTYLRILHIDRVSMSLLNSTSLAMTCQHGWKSNILTWFWEISIFWNFAVSVRVSAPAISWETPLNWSTIRYNKLVEFHPLRSFLPTCHDMSTWSQNRYLHCGTCHFFTIFKMHLRTNALVIFWETPLTSSTLEHYKLAQFQCLYSFLSYSPRLVKMLEKPKYYLDYGKSWFFKFLQCLSA